MMRPARILLVSTLVSASRLRRLLTALDQSRLLRDLEEGREYLARFISGNINDAGDTIKHAFEAAEILMERRPDTRQQDVDEIVSLDDLDRAAEEADVLTGLFNLTQLSSGSRHSHPKAYDRGVPLLLPELSTNDNVAVVRTILDIAAKELLDPAPDGPVMSYEQLKETMPVWQRAIMSARAARNSTLVSVRPSLMSMDLRNKTLESLPESLTLFPYALVPKIQVIDSSELPSRRGSDNPSELTDEFQTSDDLIASLLGQQTATGGILGTVSPFGLVRTLLQSLTQPEPPWWAKMLGEVAMRRRMRSRPARLLAAMNAAGPLGLLSRRIPDLLSQILLGPDQAVTSNRTSESAAPIISRLFPMLAPPPSAPAPASVKLTPEPRSYEMSHNPLLLGLPLPNIGYNQMESAVEMLGNATSEVVSRAQRAGANLMEPLEDRRTTFITGRDMLLSQRLDAREAALVPVRDTTEEWSRRIMARKDGFDGLINSTLLRPINETASIVGRIQSRTMDLVGHRGILRTCLLNPACCLEPEACSPA